MLNAGKAGRTRHTRIRIAVATFATVGAAAFTVGWATPASAQKSQAQHGCFGAEIIAEEIHHAPGYPVAHELVPAALPPGSCE
jgi:hypothetical protein